MAMDEWHFLLLEIILGLLAILCAKNNEPVKAGVLFTLMIALQIYEGVWSWPLAVSHQ